MRSSVGISAFEGCKIPVSASGKASDPSNPLKPLHQKNLFPNKDLGCFLERQQDAVEALQEVSAGATGRTGADSGRWVSGYGECPVFSAVDERFHVRLFGMHHAQRTPGLM
jgi:hypothetical protein